MESFEEVSSILEHTASDGYLPRGNPVKSRKNNIPHSSGDKCRAILRWGTNITFFKKTDRCNYLEYSRDAVLVIYESLLATKKIREIREIRERLRNNIEC